VTLTTETRRSNLPVAQPAPLPVREDRRLVVWMGMALTTPLDWEIIRHSTDVSSGKLAWVDRRQQRLLLSWLSMPRRPDLKQALADYKAMDREDHESVSFTALRDYPGWLGYWRDGLTRLVRYERDRNMWIELAIPWPDGRDEAVEAELAERFELLAPPPPESADKQTVSKLRATRWRAFGLDTIAPGGWMLDKATVQPANIVFSFTDLADPRRAIDIKRIGMIDVWFSGDLRQFIRDQVGYGPEITFSEQHWNEMPAIAGESMYTESGWKHLAGGKRFRTDLAWVDRRAHSVVCLTSTAPPNDPVNPFEFLVEGYSVQ